MSHALVDVETIALDAELSVENGLRAQLAAAIADNEALHAQLAIWKRDARKWEKRSRENAATLLTRSTSSERTTDGT